MNYRHAFHAGNFADCTKHAILVWLLRALARKPAPFAVLDTHAGAGRYDLSAPSLSAPSAAERTGEWRDGIARLLHDPPPPLADYVTTVQATGLYPGSPAIARALLRPQDRLVCCELHPQDARALQRLYARDPQIAVHTRDGWAALRALLPPPGIRRGLVLLDPPYEQPGEHARLANAIALAATRFPTGVIAAWYPIKHRAPVRALHAAVVAIPNVVAAELWLREPTDPARLNGNGLLIRNPPFGWAEAWPSLLAALLDRLGHREPGEGCAVQRVTPE